MFFWIIKLFHFSQEDERLSAYEVACQIGNVAERTVRNRIANLLENMHIVVSAISDPTFSGDYTLADRLIETEPAQADSAVSKIVGHDQVSYLCAMTGEYNLGATIVTDNNSELQHFLETEIRTIAGIRRINVMMVLQLYKMYNMRTDNSTWWVF